MPTTFGASRDYTPLGPAMFRGLALHLPTNGLLRRDRLSGDGEAVIESFSRQHRVPLAKRELMVWRLKKLGPDKVARVSTVVTDELLSAVKAIQIRVDRYDPMAMLALAACGGEATGTPELRHPHRWRLLDGETLLISDQPGVLATVTILEPRT